MKKKLTLPLKGEWFDMIKSGIKKEEYREINPYWVIRLFPKSERFYIKECCLDGLSKLSTADARLVLRVNIEGFINNSIVDTFDEIVFTKGYPRKNDQSRRLIFQNPKIRIGYGREEWGADKNRKQFIITWDNDN